MSIAFRPLHAVFAGEVSGIDLRQPASRADVTAIEAGMDRYAVLVFPNQVITDEQQQAFTDNFGRPNPKQGGNITQPQQKRLHSGIGDLSNLDERGAIIPAEDRRWFFKLGDRLWHSDSSYRAVPAKYSLLSGRVLPSWGGNTEFADLRAAYDALDPRTRAEVEDLVCEHSLMFSRGSIGFDALTDAEREVVPAGAAAPGAHASGNRTKIAVPVVARGHDSRLDGSRGAHVPSRFDGVRDPTAVCLFPSVAAV